MAKKLDTKNSRNMVLLLLLVVVIAVLWLLSSFSSGVIIDRVVAFFQIYSQKHFILAAFLFFVFSVLSVLLGPLTSSPLVPIAVAVWGKWLTFFLLVSGWVAGGTISYFIGRSVGYVILLRFVSQEQIEKWRKVITRETNFLFALLFRFAMPAETGYVFGLVRYEFWKFVLITIMVEIPVAIALIFVGNAFIEESFTTFAALAVLAVVVLGGAGYLLRKYLQRQDQAK